MDKKKLSYLEGRTHSRKPVNKNQPKIHLYFNQDVTKLGSFLSACTRCFRWDSDRTWLLWFSLPICCMNAYWPSVIIIFLGCEWETEFHLIVPPGPGTGQSCLPFKDSDRKITLSESKALINLFLHLTSW